MKCSICGGENYKTVGTFPDKKRIECSSCAFRSNLYNDGIVEMIACIDAVNSGIDLEDFLLNANKEKD